MQVSHLIDHNRVINHPRSLNLIQLLNLWTLFQVKAEHGICLLLALLQSSQKEYLRVWNLDRGKSPQRSWHLDIHNRDLVLWNFKLLNGSESAHLLVVPATDVNNVVVENACWGEWPGCVQLDVQTAPFIFKDVVRFAGSELDLFVVIVSTKSEDLVFKTNGWEKWLFGHLRLLIYVFV